MAPCAARDQEERVRPHRVERAVEEDDLGRAVGDGLDVVARLQDDPAPRLLPVAPLAAPELDAALDRDELRLAGARAGRGGVQDGEQQGAAAPPLVDRRAEVARRERPRVASTWSRRAAVVLLAEGAARPLALRPARAARRPRRAAVRPRPRAPARGPALVGVEADAAEQQDGQEDRRVPAGCRPRRCTTRACACRRGWTPPRLPDRGAGTIPQKVNPGRDLRLARRRRPPARRLPAAGRLGIFAAFSARSPPRARSLMLKILRDNLKYLSWILWLVIVIFIAFVFVDFGGGLSGSRQRPRRGGHRRRPRGLLPGLRARVPPPREPVPPGLRRAVHARARRPAASCRCRRSSGWSTEQLLLDGGRAAGARRPRTPRSRRRSSRSPASRTRPATSSATTPTSSSCA